MNGKVFVGQKALSLTEYEKTAPISGVILWVDDENCYEAGDETGTVIEQDCPYATQQMANNLLATLQGYSYQGLEANGAKVSPIAELGDGITVNGLYTQLAYQNIRFSTGEVMDVAAPGSDETLHEYKTEGETTKWFSHQIAETRSLISKTSEEILLKVENELEGLSSSFSVQLQQIQSQVTGLNGQVSSITQKVDNITLSVSNGSTSSSISLSVGGVTVSSQTIQMNGLVTFTGLANGTTTIDGACIKTGTIEAERLNLTGAITFSDLDTNTRGVINSASNNASTALSTAASVDMKVSGWTYPGTTEIDGSAIRTGTVEASILRGGTIELLDQDGDRIGKFTIEPTGLLGLSSVTLSSDELYFETVDPDGQILFYTGDGTGIRIEPGKTIRCDGDFQPRKDDNFWLGSSSRAWQDLYVVNDPSVVSDKNRKKNITYDMSLYDLFFDSLRPTPYKLINGNSGRTHIGLISQDVEIALFDCGLTSLDFAGFIKSPLLDNNGEETGKYNYSLRYGEFVGLCIDQIQKLKSRISKLESQKQGV